MKLFRSAFACLLSVAVLAIGAPIAAMTLFAPMTAMAASGSAADPSAFVTAAADHRVDYIAREMLQQGLIASAAILAALALVILFVLVLSIRSKRVPVRRQAGLAFPIERVPRPPI